MVMHSTVRDQGISQHWRKSWLIAITLHIFSLRLWGIGALRRAALKVTLFSPGREPHGPVNPDFFIGPLLKCHFHFSLRVLQINVNDTAKPLLVSDDKDLSSSKVRSIVALTFFFR